MLSSTTGHERLLDIDELQADAYPVYPVPGRCRFNYHLCGLVMGRINSSTDDDRYVFFST